LAARAESLPGGEQLGDLRKGITARLGFDPFTREGLLAAGIDPDRAAAIGLLAPGKPADLIVAVPLTNADLFMETAQRLAVERSGYTPAGEGTRQAKVFARGNGQLGIAVVRGYGLITRGADAGALISQAAARKPEETLARSEGLKAARSKLGGGQDFLIYAPKGSPFPAQYGAPPLPGDLALSIAPSAQGLALRLIAQMPPDAAAKAQAVLPGGGAWLSGLLPAEAPVKARMGVAAPQLLSLLMKVPQLVPLLEKADLGELFASLAPGASLSLGVEKTANLAQIVDYGLDWRRKSPFDTVQLVALAEVADEARFTKAIDALLPRLPALGMQAVRTGDDVQVNYSGGKGALFGWRKLEGKTVAYVLGGALKPEDLKRAAADKSPEAAVLAQNAGAAARADFSKLYDAVHALPPESFGSGPQAYVTRSLLGQVVDPLRPVRVTLGVMAGATSLDATLDLELVAP
ncbi:MAG TPA: hypothetical protein VH083_19735, partial [Myxococcales bacterium]|nr:hypothetical protein [Myxococcales bacterium]